MYLNHNNHSANSSYSQLLVQNSKSQRKQKAMFVLAVIAVIGLVFSFSILSNSSNLNAYTGKSNPNGNNPKNTSKTSKLSSVLAGLSSEDDQKSTGTAVRSTTTLNATKDCIPAKSYLKPVKPTVNSRSNLVISAPTTKSSYTVYGSTSEQINNQIYSCTPVLSGGKRFGASTDYSISWAIAYKQVAGSPGICKVSSAGVGLNQSMVFPNWKANKDASNQTKKQWQSFITNLQSHETEHAQINKQYANKILDTLRNMPATSCATISSQANAKANNLVKDMNKANSSLDGHTNHGATTGARL